MLWDTLPKQILLLPYRQDAARGSSLWQNHFRGKIKLNKSTHSIYIPEKEQNWKKTFFKRRNLNQIEEVYSNPCREIKVVGDISSPPSWITSQKKGCCDIVLQNHIKTRWTQNSVSSKHINKCLLALVGHFVDTFNNWNMQFSAHGHSR